VCVPPAAASFSGAITTWSSSRAAGATEWARIRRGLLTVRTADGPPVGHQRSVRNVSWPGAVWGTKRTAARAGRTKLYASQRYRSRCRGSRASAATIPPSTAPRVVRPAAYAAVAAVRKTAPMRFAKRGGRASSSAPRDTRVHELEVGEHGRQNRRRASARRATAPEHAEHHHQPLASASVASRPIVAW